MANYTKEQTQNIVAGYTKAMEDGADTVEAVKAVAKAEGKTVAMIRSKLVAEKVYVAKEAAKPTAKAVVRKASIVKAIEDKTGIKSLVSLEKATKADLEALLRHVS